MLHINTPCGDHYIVNDRGEIALAEYINNHGAYTSTGQKFSGQWLVLGIEHVKRHEFIPLEDLTPERVSKLELLYKNGNPQYTVRDLDCGTMRTWGNTRAHGIESIYFDKGFTPLARVNGSTLNTRARLARQAAGTVYLTGKTWEGYKREYSYPITRGDLDKIGELTRDNVSEWLKARAGDFETIIDFSATIGDIIIDWAK